MSLSVVFISAKLYFFLIDLSEEGARIYASPGLERSQTKAVMKGLCPIHQTMQLTSVDGDSRNLPVEVSNGRVCKNPTKHPVRERTTVGHLPPRRHQMGKGGSNSTNSLNSHILLLTYSVGLV